MRTSGWVRQTPIYLGGDDGNPKCDQLRRRLDVEVVKPTPGGWRD